MAATVAGLAPRGKLMVLGAADPMQVNPLQLLMARRSIEGWYSGTSIDSQETVNFSQQMGVKSMNEVFPLDKAAEGYQRMLSGKARFRVVLKMES
jgi:D-arabinose 1-dehydrogenase-like Zn-dependent alcohol dehydrogenase